MKVSLKKGIRKVVFARSDDVTVVPVCLFQSSDQWRFKKVKTRFGPDMEYPVGPHMAQLRADRLAKELSR